MTHSKKCFILFVSLLTAIGIGCKKDKNGTGLSAGKRVVVTTIAGDGTSAVANGPALSAKFHAPVDVAVAADGTLYVSDYSGERIRKIAAGQVSTFAGSDSSGILNGNGASSRFEDPYRIAVDAGGNLYILEQMDPRIRRIAPTADVSTYAGTDSPGFLNGAAATAQFGINAGGVATDAQGNVYLADSFNGRIRKISVAGEVSTVAGSGTVGFRDGDAGTAQFRYPDGIALDSQGNLYVADEGNFRIRKITPAGVVSTFAGSGTSGNADGNAAAAQFSFIGDIVADSQGNLYVTDDNRIRKISLQGVVTTIAGSVSGYADGDGLSAKFAGPGGLGIDAQWNVYVADIQNNRIRKISFQ